MELFLFILFCLLLIALMSPPTAASVYIGAVGGPANKALGCGSLLTFLVVILLIALVFFAAMGGGIVGDYEVRPVR